MRQDHGGQKYNCLDGRESLLCDFPWFGEMDREEGADRRREEFLETKTGRRSHIYLRLVNLDQLPSRVLNLGL